MKGHQSVELAAGHDGSGMPQTTRPFSVRWWRRHRQQAVVGLAALALAFVVGCSPAAPASSVASSAASSPATAQVCPWLYATSAYTNNQFGSDPAAMYWLEPFEVIPGLQIIVSGTFPDARYASLQVYDARTGPIISNGVGPSLPDYLITPDTGSVNPWQQQASAGGSFTVTLREDVASGQVNTLPLAPAGTTSGQGYLQYRVYLPAGGDFSQVTPPTLTLKQTDPSGSLPPCVTRTSVATALPSMPTLGPTVSPAAPSPSASQAPAVGQLEFFYETFDVLFPNMDAAYVFAYLTPPGPDDVVVIRARAPTHATGDHPSPWPAADEDLRYWSMCIGLATGVLPTVMNLAPAGGIDTGCRADDQVRLDAAGDYAFVLGTEAQRATIEGVADTTFLPFSAAQPATTHVLMLRSLLPSPSFAYSPAQVTGANDPAGTEAAMGPYYPHATVCALSTLVASGVSSCFT